ncbi:nuclear transport factor 2 family protein [Nonomuraea longispora]|uniref:Nuclear transport factor 2 family protein n=1 Tax=Nonomuraea longispora TaxID=1848320 RepID=A0A4R4N2N3_9ACTN|nr:nuclear transport factor 2 family protein [Nonomuraea longispora]TDC02959.1 nuclear transport factor 2 family protein [Nonomuraea longispora]
MALAMRPVRRDDHLMDTQEIADRLEITGLLARYAHALDSGRWHLLDEVFTADAVIDYTSAGGIRGARDEVRVWLAGVLEHWPGRLHLIGAPSIDVRGGEARVSAPFTDTLAPTKDLVAADAEGFLHGGGWYHHLMCRTPGGWRSVELVEEQS